MYLFSLWKRLHYSFRSNSRSRRDTRGPIQLGHNRIYILPTKTGLGFFMLLGVMLLISINYNNPPGYLLTFLLAGIALVGIFHTHRGLSGLLVSYGRALPVFAGFQAVFPIIIVNPTSIPRHAIRVGWCRTDAESGNIDAWSQEHALCRDIDARQEMVYNPTLLAETRGLLRPARIVVSTVFPLGLYRAWSWVLLPLNCVVYPAPASRAAPLASSDALGQSAQTRTDRDGDEYDGLRGYRDGDHVRRIAWKAVARGAGLVSKDFIGEVEGDVILLDWDALAGEETEAKLSQLCRGVLDAEKAGRSYSLRMPGRHVPPGLGPAQMHACLQALALYGRKTSEPF
ncbi:Uncharacterized conserved protein, DUF58 family, contains vWF domain [Desulfonatronum thiosulfatophilum]|uniref:Uncharacterized conserved protein, DUF58 family, contains vWF domain n=1 Tax=Desulfonatronum thiosulfatophilum TaxID=617002 RepID=A0A1G6ERC4_9BACT|nr:DUF58 domain-containing protein [Desulfonatronum thiosulfatophilum]SDB59971.1 Uncharacterized conserved protein, DUF58 family, contains vWF domain [Desulfonatronum thiosulfatophilum]